MSGERMNRIRALLERALSPQRLDLRDDSAAHVGHAGARGGAGHYSVLIVAEAFRGLSMRERHRAVYSALGSMFPAEVHALSIRALVPGEAADSDSVH
jgi:BolA protein